MLENDKRYAPLIEKACKKKWTHDESLIHFSRTATKLQDTMSSGLLISIAHQDVHLADMEGGKSTTDVSSLYISFGVDGFPPRYSGSIVGFRLSFPVA